MPIYLKYGKVDGAVTNKSYQKWIEVDSFTWGVSVAVQTTSGNTTNRQGSGKVTPADFVITKSLDDASIQLKKDCVQGVVTDPVEIAVVAMAGEDLADEYEHYTFSNVLVSSFSTSGGGDGKPHEQFSFNFTKFQNKQQIRDAKNVARQIIAGYDFETARKL